MKKILKNIVRKEKFTMKWRIQSVFLTSSVQASLINRIHITKSHFLFVTGFFMDRSIYFNHATHSFEK